MKISKEQAKANRKKIVEEASRLFCERGFDGVSIVDIMASAGFTHGGFYKSFDSKAGLMAEASANALSRTTNKNQESRDLRAFVERYLSKEHRERRDEGCALAALCGDAARQPEMIKEVFKAGLETLLTSFGEDGEKARARQLEVMAQLLGALVLSRACPDESPLAEEILSVSRSAVLSRLKTELTPCPDT